MSFSLSPIKIEADIEQLESFTAWGQPAAGPEVIALWQWRAAQQAAVLRANLSLF